MKNEIGNRYGRLVVTHRDHTINKPQVYWICLCDCGNTHTVRGTHLRGNKISSCGCLQRELTAQRNTTHGRSKSPIHRAFHAMNNRCLNPFNREFKYYGDRGIMICDRWHRDTPNAFDNFVADMGERPSDKHSIDRIDNDGHYTPENCRWATVEEQRNNKRDNVTFTHRGRTQTIAQWARELNVDRRLVYLRISRGREKERALGLETSK